MCLWRRAATWSYLSKNRVRDGTNENTRHLPKWRRQKDVIAAVNECHGVLVVADWRTDPYAVVATCRRRASQGDVRFAVVVPAWLHGLDRAGDPRASRPCAARQLETIVRLAESARLEIDVAGRRRARADDPETAARGQPSASSPRPRPLKGSRDLVVTATARVFEGRHRVTIDQHSTISW